MDCGRAAGERQGEVNLSIRAALMKAIETLKAITFLQIAFHTKQPYVLLSMCAAFAERKEVVVHNFNISATFYTPSAITFIYHSSHCRRNMTTPLRFLTIDAGFSQSN